MSRLIVVDGYNLVLRSPLLQPGPDRTLREARAKLVNLLSWTVGVGEARFIVVFDGSDERPRDDRPEHGARVEVRYSRPPAKADDLIRALVEELMDRDERVTVVTSDLEVARHARAMGADVALADLFLTSIVSPAADDATPEKPATVSRRELEEWADLFRNRARDAESDPDA